MSRRIIDNPFFVLELSLSCTAAEVESQGQKLLAMLEMGLRSVSTYPTPLGSQPRDSEKLRQAMAELRQPEKRLVHEIWAHHGIDETPEPGTSRASTNDLEPATRAWPEALQVFGWR